MMQRYIRQRHLNKLYNTLVVGRNPSVKTVRSFVHLLDDSELDFDNDIALDELRQKITNRIQENNQLDKYINTVDIQIALFLKNAISMEELMSRSGAIKRRKQRALKQRALDGPPKSDRYSLAGMNKESRERLELYQKLVYLLQTEPRYLARLLTALTNHQVLGRWSDFTLIESTVLSLFAYATNAREEYLLIKLCQHCIQEEMKMLRVPQEFLLGNYAFMKLIVQTNRGIKEREFFKQLVQPLVKLVIDDESLDLESNPIMIYQKMISDEELQTGVPTQRPYQVTAQSALADSAVRDKFIANLRDLRHITNCFLSSIISAKDDMPYTIRFIAKELRVQLEEAFPEESQEHIFRIIGHFIYYRYLNPAFVAPEQYDVIEGVISPVQRKNLAEVSKMLQYISSGKSFNDVDHFLSPLKDYVQEASSVFSQWFMEVTEVAPPEEHFGMDLWTDCTLTQKPVVYLTPEELFHLHYVLEQNIQTLEPGTVDKTVLQQQGGGIPLFDLMTALGLSGYDDASHSHSSEATVRLCLQSFRDELPMDAAAWLRQILFDAKRLVVYVIKHQCGPTLLDILNSPVVKREEHAWQAFKQFEFKTDNELASKRRWLHLGTAEEPLDLADLTLSQLKQLTCRLVLHLERCKVITEAGGYQDVMNMIAQDITGKHTRRKQRSKEMTRMTVMLLHLCEKGQYLMDQATKYEDYLSGCMASMANKTWRDKKLKATLFSRQYYHLRGIHKAGLPVPKFGTYRYTAKQMRDRGILVDLQYAGVTVNKYDKIDMVFSMAQAGVITIEASYQGWKHLPPEERHIMDTVAKTLQNATVIRLDLHYEDLLQSQFEGVYLIAFIDGSVKVNLNLLIYFINKKFYS
ncbi:Rho GTPase activation protein [Hesseltinella vesiculosa]|uniref:Rho GTPase activation protein n=1 Tax=Hesseltinella vesiculosa TaxID=101127 RepID=A0A1X2GB57_9FUNG|nr:Rho GTPase activation protein [Hesseltinella vesiculosa]